MWAGPGAGRSQPLATAKRSAAETEESHPRLGLYFRKDLQRVLQSGPDHVTQGDVRGVETHEQAGSRGEGLPGLEGGWAVNRRLRHLQRLALLGRSRRPRPAGFYFREVPACPLHALSQEVCALWMPVRKRKWRRAGGRLCHTICKVGSGHCCVWNW